MRIIGGEAGGLKLTSPGAKSKARPTPDRVREALFNIINVSGSSFLDIFSGSGAVGCEAISRGADDILFVEFHKSSVKTIKANMEKVTQRVGHNPSVKLLEKDVLQVIKKDSASSFDFIFADPPYDMENQGEAIKLLLANRFLSDGGALIWETATRRISEMPQPDRIKSYGDTTILFYSTGGK